MGADKHETDRKERTPPFVMALKSTMDAPAWRAMSHGARSLYYALKRRYNQKGGNNGRLFISQRDAAKEIGSHHTEIARWFRELQHYGFIVKTAGASLGVEGKGKAPHWRLTEVGYMRDMPTNDFQRWDGTRFKNKKTESRAGNGARGVPEMEHGSVLEMAHTPGAKRAGNGAHIGGDGCAGNGAHNKLTTSTPSASVPLTISPQLLEIERKRAQRPLNRALASARYGGR